MKRIIIITLLLVQAVMASAQDGLAVNQLFDGRFRSDSHAVETIISGSQMRDYNLDLYHSLVVTGKPELAPEIERCVRRDGAKATDSEVTWRDGRLHYGLYVLPQVRRGRNRYLLYLNKGHGESNRITLIYVEGKASVKDIKSLIKSNK